MKRKIMLISEVCLYGTYEHLSLLLKILLKENFEIYFLYGKKRMDKRMLEFLVKNPEIHSIEIETFESKVSFKDLCTFIKIRKLIKEIKPDIVVLTGHDSVLKESNDYLDLNNYRNSKYYIDAVKALRNYNSSYDELVIFAGACQSCYECLLDAGANFASSPSRVLIHCLDPVFVCEKIAYTTIDSVVSITNIVENTITGIKGIGGLQTRGKYREGYPKSPFI